MIDNNHFGVDLNEDEENMHYKNGREAHNGDKVVMQDYNGNVTVGVLYDATVGNDFCNGRLAPISGSDPSPNLKDCLHLDDVKAAIQACDNCKGKKE